MSTSDFDSLKDDEQEDFISACAKRDLKPTDFVIQVHEKFPEGPGVGPVDRQVLVTRTGTGAHRNYAAGNGTSWNYAFEQDLIAGLFG
ncbi:hypothetical protein OTERR_12910 [Oryzomicrobium terrae]|uniref:Uncharacterized protein n=1 Tax=Oryzomicrobium terrae TaxID=1735038 RepID=A0A5C1E9D8_9RHOO|nr:hypothetical protein [Oryzomicrobium terrae]QEL64767.1 hypothetical protein OTERR_12910 [Oryzomicrobium terrae]